MIEIVEYLYEDGSSPFADWFEGLGVQAALKINTCVTRMGNGNLSNVKSVGAGVHECRVDWGPGYRVYFGKEGDKLIILLGGGTKKRQQTDINKAKELWKDYKIRKKKQ